MKNISSNRKILRLLALLFLAVAVVSIGLFFVKIWDNGRGFFPTQDVDTDKSVEYDGKKYVLNESIETILVMGLDKFSDYDGGEESYRNEHQADFLMLLIIDREKKTCEALHINRDAMTDVTVRDIKGNPIGKKVMQIALAHTYGSGKVDSCNNTSLAVTELLHGIPIDRCISLKMDAVPALNDLVGGVTLEILDDFSGIDDSLVKGETVTLKGQHALTYVRTRYGMDDSSNASRMIRQRQYLNALYQKTAELSSSDGEFVLNAINTASSYMVSDCTPQKLQDIFNTCLEYKIGTIHSIEGTSTVGKEFMEFYPDEQKLQKTLIDLFYIEKK